MPSIKAVARELSELKRSTLAVDVPECEVRLQVSADGVWRLHCGDPCYDTDHRGCWGAGVVGRTTNCRELAKELIDEVAEQAAQCEPNAGDGGDNA
jgi:hypothetical protein